MMRFDAENYAGKRVCVALSGGMDSVCLLHLLKESLPAGKLSAVHVEHGIRGESSRSDMRFCRELCAEWGIPLYVVRADVPALARERGQGIEETARQVRYDIFSRLVQEGKTDLVATAHHRDDVAETVLFRLARGTSPAGMRAVTEYGSLIRPLLCCTREEISSYMEEHALPHVEDPTNADERYTRNYIRRTVMPAFEKISGGAKEHLVHFAERCSEDDEYLQELARKEIRENGEERRFPLSLPKPLFIRACMLCMDGGQDMTASALEEVFQLKTKQSGRKIALHGGYIACREGEDVVFFKPKETAAEVVPFTGVGNYGGFEVTLGIGAGMRVDLDAFPAGCEVRTRREGDFIVPFGGGRKTLKKFFTDRKIPARIGCEIPLIAKDSEVLLAVGVEIADRVKITEQTVHAGRITWEETKWNFTRIAR